jgi:hypothetical protein
MWFEMAKRENMKKAAGQHCQAFKDSLQQCAKDRAGGGKAGSREAN